MGIELIISLVVALIGYLGAKKMGADDATALGVAGAAGLGTYYVTKNTDWGKGIVDDIERVFGIAEDDNGPILNEDGSPARIPEGAEPMKDQNGDYMYDENGELRYKFPTGSASTTVGGALDKLLDAGTTALPYVAGAAVASSLFDKPWFPWVAGGALILLLGR